MDTALHRVSSSLKVQTLLKSTAVFNIVTRMQFNTVPDRMWVGVGVCERMH